MKITLQLPNLLYLKIFVVYKTMEDKKGVVMSASQTHTI